jgi:hypothetical protein
MSRRSATPSHCCVAIPVADMTPITDLIHTTPPYSAVVQSGLQTTPDASHTTHQAHHTTACARFHPVHGTQQDTFAVDALLAPATLSHL